MASPRSADARLYYRCAFRRFEEANLLLESDYSTGAVYLAGYAIECMLKALALEVTPSKARAKVLKQFRGSKAHDYEWLRSLYFIAGGSRPNPEVVGHFTLVNDWSTDLRYLPSTIRAVEAREFLASTHAIIKWADGRL